MKRYDAAVVGSGPNGLAAAITLAEAGRSVVLLEAAETIGGGARSAELTLPGFVSDVCSAVHPLGVSSPFFRRQGLERHGLEWIHPELALAHPLDDGSAAELHRSLAATADALGDDGRAYTDLVGPFVERWDELAAAILSPVTRLPPPAPLLMARFGLASLRSAVGLASNRFRTPAARALFIGMAAHAILPLHRPLTSSFGLVLGAAAHGAGWPIARGGSQAIVDALAARLCELGAEVRTSTPVRRLADLPPARVALFDVTPRQLLAIAGDRVPGGYRKQLERYRYGPGAFKLDYALAGPIPWKAEACRRAGTVHVGGTMPEIAAAERATWRGRMPERPYVLVGQQSQFDRTRAPEGREVGWAYCHVPHGYDGDATAAIEAQIERFAPGFRELVLARRVTPPAALEAYNANNVGGDIAGGAHDGLQLFFRPGIALDPYRTPIPGVYLCSASTPPGGGVHGMCGYWAARSALRHELR